MQIDFFYLYNFCVVLLRAYVDACVYPRVVFIPIDDSIRRFNLLVAPLSLSAGACVFLPLLLFFCLSD